jgi:hypothetical protein
MLRCVVDFIEDGEDLLAFLDSFRYCEGIGDLALLLRFLIHGGVHSSDAWPVLTIYSAWAQNSSLLQKQLLSQASRFFALAIIQDVSEVSILRIAKRPHIELRISDFKQIFNWKQTRIHTLTFKGAWDSDLPLSLINLDLSSSLIGDNRCKKLAKALSQCPNLECLILKSNEIGADGITILATNLHKLLNLKSLNLNYNSIKDAGCYELAILLQRSKSLETVEIRGNHITAEGSYHITSILGSSSLLTLRLGSNNIGPEGCQYLSDFLPISRLLSLDVSDNQVGHDACSSIAMSTTLLSLDISNNFLKYEIVKNIMKRSPIRNISWNQNTKFE